MKMRVDTGQRTIAFAVNNGEWKVIAKITNSATPYYMAVQMCLANQSITLSKNTFIGANGAQKEELKEPDDQVLSLSF